MPRQRNSILGVELTNREIKVVETVFANGKSTILTAGSAAMPYGGMHEGLPLRIDTVATALKQLVDSIGASTRDAVIGLPSGAYICRPISMPPVPDAELPVLVEGEVRHYMILNTPNAPFGFFKLKTTQRETAQQVMLVGAEEGAISAYRELAHKAGLNIIAIEPLAISMRRAASVNLNDEESFVHLAALDQSTEISVGFKGEICLYRRIDIGIVELFTGTTPPPVGDLAPQFDMPSTPKHGAEPESLSQSAVSALVTEIRRSIEFYEREFPEAPGCEKLRLSCSDKRFDALAKALSFALEVEVALVHPPYDNAGPRATMVLADASSSTYAGVSGLSQFNKQSAQGNSPAIDLYVHERKSVEVQVKRKGFAGALSVSILAVLAGIYGGLHFGLKAIAIEHELEHKDEELALLAREQRLSADQELKRKQDILALSKDNAPLQDALHMVSECLDGGCGIEELSLVGSHQLTLRGEATESGSVIQTVKMMQQHRSVLSATISSIEKINKTDGNTVKFQISGIIIGNSQADAEEAK